jgi:hypothetical protein
MFNVKEDIALDDVVAVEGEEALMFKAREASVVGDQRSIDQ